MLIGCVIDRCFRDEAAKLERLYLLIFVQEVDGKQCILHLRWIRVHWSLNHRFCVVISIARSRPHTTLITLTLIHFN